MRAFTAIRKSQTQAPMADRLDFDDLHDLNHSMSAPGTV
jgi:hypothetical protein